MKERQVECPEPVRLPVTHPGGGFERRQARSRIRMSDRRNIKPRRVGILLSSGLPVRPVIIQEHAAGPFFSHEDKAAMAQENF